MPAHPRKAPPRAKAKPPTWTFENVVVDNCTFKEAPPCACRATAPQPPATPRHAPAAVQATGEPNAPPGPTASEIRAVLSPVWGQLIRMHGLAVELAEIIRENRNAVAVILDRLPKEQP